MEYSDLQRQVMQGALPRHIAVIMDGNGRWGRQHGGGRFAGHRAGAEALRRVVEEARRIGVEYLTVFAFSTENWRRPAEEVELLMRLLGEYLDRETENLLRNDIRLNFIGDETRLSQSLRAKMAASVQKTAACRHTTFTIALNYGGRQDICRAARLLAEEAAAQRLDPQEIDESLFASRLYTADMPEVDLLLRTSGEQRISNFLLWQSAYAELYVTDTLWPDFDEKALLTAISAYQQRERRFGGIK